MDNPVSVPVVNIESITETRPDHAINNDRILEEGLDLSGYRGTHDAPFVADYFGIRDFYKTNPEVQAQVDEITQDLIEQTQGESLVFAAKDIMDTISQELNVNENDTGLFKLKKALELMRAKRRLRQMDAMRNKALADIENML